MDDTILTFTDTHFDETDAVVCNLSHKQSISLVRDLLDKNRYAIVGCEECGRKDVVKLKTGDDIVYKYLTCDRCKLELCTRCSKKVGSIPFYKCATMCPCNEVCEMCLHAHPNDYEISARMFVCKMGHNYNDPDRGV